MAKSKITPFSKHYKEDPNWAVTAGHSQMPMLVTQSKGRLWNMPEQGCSNGYLSAEDTAERFSWDRHWHNLWIFLREQGGSDDWVDLSQLPHPADPGPSLHEGYLTPPLQPWASSIRHFATSLRSGGSCEILSRRILEFTPEKFKWASSLSKKFPNSNPITPQSH